MNEKISQKQIDQATTMITTALRGLMQDESVVHHNIRRQMERVVRNYLSDLNALAMCEGKVTVAGVSHAQSKINVALEILLICDGDIHRKIYKPMANAVREALAEFLRFPSGEELREILGKNLVDALIARNTAKETV